jgi:hypothetical protein
MGLDMRPMGKPKPGFEQRFNEIFRTLQSAGTEDSNFVSRLFGKKKPSREELLKEWFDNQISTYKTIGAPRVGVDKEADDWIRSRYNDSDKKLTEKEFVKQHDGYYVIELAKEQDGVPVYISLQQDENVFRGQFMADCEELIGKDLVSEAWETKLSEETLDYGQRLMSAADQIAAKYGLQYLKAQRQPPESDDKSTESRLHIVYSLARWLIFYGSNGHGYEADF